MNSRTINTAEAQNTSSMLEGITIESAIQEMQENLRLCLFTWKKNSLELEMKIKLQKEGLTSSEVKTLMPAERRRINKLLNKDHRLTATGIREALTVYSEEIKNQTIDTHTIEDLNCNLVHGTNKNLRIRDATKLVYIFTALAELEQNQSKVITAWKAMTRAQYYYGLLTGLDDPNTYMISDRASQGGEARSQKLKQHKLSKQIMLDLLHKMVPQDKWRNYHMAADAVFGPFIEQLRTEAVNLPQDESDLKADLTNLIVKHKKTFVRS